VPAGSRIDPHNLESAHQGVKDMQARLSLHKFPTRIAIVLVVLIAALTLGGILGYTTKPATVVTRATHTVVVPAHVPAQAPAQGGPGGRVGGPLS
jgi:hypothetical protein